MKESNENFAEGWQKGPYFSGEVCPATLIDHLIISFQCVRLLRGCSLYGANNLVLWVREGG